MSNYYKLLERHYIGGAIREEGEVVTFNDDPKKGGMTPGKRMVPCDAEGNEVKRKPTKGKSSEEDLG